MVTDSESDNNHSMCRNNVYDSLDCLIPVPLTVDIKKVPSHTAKVPALFLRLKKKHKIEMKELKMKTNFTDLKLTLESSQLFGFITHGIHCVKGKVATKKRNRNSTRMLSKIEKTECKFECESFLVFADRTTEHYVNQRQNFFFFKMRK